MTAYEMRISDWSSDLCSSDLAAGDLAKEREVQRRLLVERRDAHEAGKPEPQDAALGDEGVGLARSDAGLLRLLAGIHLDVALRCDAQLVALPGHGARSEEHTSELQSLMRISYAVVCLKKKH